MFEATTNHEERVVDPYAMSQASPNLVVRDTHNRWGGGYESYPFSKIAETTRVHRPKATSCSFGGLPE